MRFRCRHCCLRCPPLLLAAVGLRKSRTYTAQGLQNCVCWAAEGFSLRLRHKGLELTCGSRALLLAGYTLGRHVEDLTHGNAKCRQTKESAAHTAEQHKTLQGNPKA